MRTAGASADFAGPFELDLAAGPGFLAATLGAALAGAFFADLAAGSFAWGSGSLFCTALSGAFLVGLPGAALPEAAVLACAVT